MQTTIVTFCPRATSMIGQALAGTPWSTLSLKPNSSAMMRKPLGGLVHPAGSVDDEVVDLTLFKPGRKAARAPAAARTIARARKRYFRFDASFDKALHEWSRADMKISRNPMVMATAILSDIP